MSHLPENHDLNALLAFLDQAATLAASSSDHQWTLGNEGFRDSTLGQHMRHTLDHVEALCAGLPQGEINYDARRRGQTAETSPTTANSRCLDLQQRLRLLGENHQSSAPVNSLSSSCTQGRSHAQPSSFGRELQFVISHTVHHFAIIAAICHSQGVPTSSGFGIAPSTLKHHETISA